MTAGVAGTEAGASAGAEYAAGALAGAVSASETGVETGDNAGVETGGQKAVETGGQTGVETGVETGDHAGVETGGKKAGPQVRVFGIRHHGPGSARAVLRALEEFDPQTVLIEGPADADPVLVHAASVGMVPPVALLAYDMASPRRSAFWPFAVFSPEWQALTWALNRGAAVRMCDLPSSIVLGVRAAAETAAASAETAAAEAAATQSGPEEMTDHPAAEETAGETPSERVAADSPGTSAPVTAPGPQSHETPTAATNIQSDFVRDDPIATLAAAAGYDDPERWWEDVLESRPDSGSPFDAVAEAMTELRAQGVGREPTPQAQQQEDCREAHMRKVLRSEMTQGISRIAVICGAWHVPALNAPLPSAASDARLLRGLPTVKTAIAWVPWTHSRLAAASGYGAGVLSPGWYHHLFTVTEQPVTRWLVSVAERLRAEDLPVSSAHVIEAVRLAETLAVMRGRPLAGLSEVTESSLAVICEGSDLALDLVQRDLVVGEALGQVPPEVPLVPLEADLRAWAKKLRLVIGPLEKVVSLDLRKDNDGLRSRLLHRLVALGVEWGRPAADAVRNSGTFRESWNLLWRPEFAVDIVEAAMWGTTVEAAAGAKLVDRATGATTLPQVTAAVRVALLADLPDALAEILAVLRDRAAVDLDVEHLMRALPALVEAARYGDVRGTDIGEIATAAEEVLLRVCTGLPVAIGGLDADGAVTMKSALDAVHAAVLLRGNDSAVAAGRARWMGTLAGAADRRDLSGLLAGRMTRLLLDAGEWSADQVAMRLGRALSVGATAAFRGDWVEGFTSGGGLLLIHDSRLLGLLDGWLSELDAQEFVDLLPLLRRTFGTFAPGERRQLGQKAVRVGRSSASDAVASAEDFDDELAGPAISTVMALFGVDWPAGSVGSAGSAGPVGSVGSVGSAGSHGFATAGEASR